MANVIWSPQEKQRQFQARDEYEVLYGGAAGGGKSDALLTEALRQVHIPHYRAILFRKTYPQLTELIDRSRELYGAAFPDAKFHKTERCWVFASGAKIYFGAMQRPEDRFQYQGKRYDFIGFDELTHFTWEEYSYLFSRNRPGGPGTRVYMRATANPGGIGHAWVKARFISAAPPLTPIEEEVTVHTPEGLKTLRRSRIFVPATVFDNEKLLGSDPNYLANLALLPEAERNALLYGKWDAFDGQVFGEWRNDPAHYADGKFTHVIEPFRIPAHWRIWRGFDFGYAKPFSVGWYAADETGKLYRIREYYGCTGKPNQGVMLDAVAIAAEIRRIESEDPNLCGRNIIGVADPSIFDQSRGASIADLMARHPNFVLWHKGDNHRLAGKMQMHYRLAFDAEGECGLQVFSTCRHFIRTIPALCYDTRNVEDVNTAMEDHIYDECRYVLMDRPVSPPEKPAAHLIGDDPLNQRTENR
ncbi:MAG: terminase family protein [Clostridia bacterium]|nr:terminase family protein [Clostridia bacterium]